jgi:signal transduction histidine kinase
MTELIDTLLQISTLSKFENKEKINLKEEIENILSKNTNLKDFNVNIDLENIYKNINKNHFIILFTNLLNNAIKYNNENKTINIYLNKNKLIIENT